MGKITWGGVEADDIDKAERNQFSPYDGPLPPNGVYAFKIKFLRMTTSSTKNPQMVVGMELVPRSGRDDQKAYKGYFLMDYLPIQKSTAFRYAPFLDAIGVSGSDFVNRTTDDGSEKRNIVKIGKWVNDGKKFILASIVDGQDQKGNPRKEVAAGGYFAPPATGAAPEPEPEEPDTDGASDDADDDPPF